MTIYFLPVARCNATLRGWSDTARATGYRGFPADAGARRRVNTWRPGGIGHYLSVGTILSVIMVLIVLPGLLYLFDAVVMGRKQKKGKIRQDECLVSDF